ncbi:MAG TPA: flagellar biosynthetic protein FliO [Desulfobacterales bacterium]|nr:flagellar biosynthetic protein FliO [Desulfobacterales bacterium]
MAVKSIFAYQVLPLMLAGRAAAASSNPAAPGSDTMNLMAAVARMAGALALVVGLLLLLIYILKKSGLAQGVKGGGTRIKIIETRMVAPKKYIAIADVAGKYMALGITEHNINLLTRLKAEDLDGDNSSAEGVGGGASFSAALKQAIPKFSRRSRGEGSNHERSKA